MAFQQRLDQFAGKVKDRIEHFSKLHEASQQQQQQQQAQHPQPGPHSAPVQHPAPPPPSSPPSSYWSPAFDPNTPVSSDFKHETGDWGWGNHELQNYTSSPQNAFYTADHKLLIRAIANSASPDPHAKYTSARLRSIQTLARPSGYLTAVLTPPSATGIWPAFWLLPRDPFTWPSEGEVDICESWNGSLTNQSHLHWGHFTAEDANKHRGTTTPMPTLATQPNTFAFAWQQPDPGHGGQMLWYINGAPIMKATIPGGLRPMNDWQLIINVAMGGDVCQGAIPADGSYDFVVHSLALHDEPVGGWAQFSADLQTTPEGKPM